jgi:pimeloyl-ACP methyl ester carboxylesterase
MKTISLLTILASATVLAARAQDITGDWQGTLKPAPGAELHLLLHISKTADGSLKGTLDSVDQSANGIPISAMAFRNGTLTFASDAIQGRYEGKMNAEGSAVEGAWTQSGPMPLAWRRAVEPSDIDGAWEGVLDVGQKLRLILHLTTTKDGLGATLDSPDQGAGGIGATAVKRDGSSLTVEIANIGAKYQGTIAKDYSSIDGTFSQGGGQFPLTLKRAASDKKIEEPKRPQNPVKPYPYRAEDLTYPNTGAGIQLAATLTIPTGKGPFPAVVLITGSGQQDRDESLLGHKPFLVLSDYLTRKGIAVLRSDDRGAGGSGGNFAAATTADFATDVEAAVAYLKTRPEVDPRCIGLAGHSAGGVIAPMVAARNRDIAFIVMMAGTGVPGDRIIVAQVVAGAEAEGMSHDAAAAAGVRQKRILDLVEQEKDESVLKEKLRAELKDVPEAQFATAFKQLTSPWYRYFLTYDPSPALRKVTCPVLVLNGAKDTQVPPKLNLPAIRKALEDGGNRDFEVDELPGLNHLFQHAKTGAFSEYAQIEETFAPEALEKIASWIGRVEAVPAGGGR